MENYALLSVRHKLLLRGLPLPLPGKPMSWNHAFSNSESDFEKTYLSHLRLSLLRRIATLQQRADQTQDQIKTRSKRLTMKLGLIMDPDYPLLKNGKMDVSTWIPFCIFAKQLLPKPLPTSSKPRKMRFESSKTSTRKTENLAHLTYPHTECGMRKKSRLGHLCASVHEAITLYQR